MKDKNIALEVIPVSNGWLVRYPARMDGYRDAPMGESVVFQSFAELAAFLRGHFTFRQDLLTADKPQRVA